MDFSFSQLEEKFDLPPLHFFRYLQLRNYARTSISHFELLTDENEIYKLLSPSPNALNLISCFIDVFTSQLNVSTLYLKDSCEEDLGIQITNEDWIETI